MDDCLFCQLAQGKVPTIKIYEDEDIMIVLDIAPANLGQVLIFPKKHYVFIWDIPDEILFKITTAVKYVSSAIVSATKAQGFNVYIPQGPIAGQRIPHFAVYIIPRFENDGVSFEWNRKQYEQNDLIEMAQKIISSFNFAGHSKPQPQEIASQNVTQSFNMSIQQPKTEKKKVVKEKVEEEKDYSKMYKALKRKP